VPTAQSGAAAEGQVRSDGWPEEARYGSGFSGPSVRGPAGRAG